MTYLFDFDGSDTTSQQIVICPVHWVERTTWESEETTLLAIATVMALDGRVCHVPCTLRRITLHALEISERTPTPLPDKECEPMFVSDSRRIEEWQIAYPNDIDERDVDIAWMRTPMPPTEAGIVRDAEGNERPVLLSPRLLKIVDGVTQTRNWLVGRCALAGVLSVTYVAASDAKALGPQPLRDLEVRWPIAPDDGEDGLVKLEEDGDDPRLYGDAWSQICREGDFACDRLCEEFDRGNARRSASGVL